MKGGVGRGQRMLGGGINVGFALVGAFGMNIVPKDFFGIVERFSVFAAVGYNAVLGIELFRMDFNHAKNRKYG